MAGARHPVAGARSLAAGVALAVALQAAEPAARLYILISPSLLAGLAALLGTGVLAAVALMRRRAALAGAAAADAAVRRAAAEATQDRLRFLMRLDHELKNPLTAIRAGLANIDQGGPRAADGTAAAVASVSAQADRITRLVGDLRKLADLETQEIETAPVDLPGLLHEVAEAAAEIPGASQRIIRVTVPRAPWPLPLIEGDRDLLFIAIQNLVANAVKFSAPGDTVEVRASEDDNGLLLEVADTGPASRRTRSGRSGRNWPAAAPPAACPGPASGWRWCASSPPGTTGGSRSAAGTARARWSASGSRHPAVPDRARCRRSATAPRYARHDGWLGS